MKVDIKLTVVVIDQMKTAIDLAGVVIDLMKGVIRFWKDGNT